MWKSIKFLANTAVLSFLPLLTFWWLFLPLSLASIIFSGNIYPALAAGFLLDLAYLGKWPVMLAVAAGWSVLFIALRDKIRPLEL